MTAARDIEVRLARTSNEIDAAQQLRYRVFYEEWGARADPRMQLTQRDSDEFDSTMEHLIVIDHARSRAEGQVVGNYRLQRSDRLGPNGRFYSSGEFDLGPLLGSRRRLLELGRSCVLHEYRSMPILQRLWGGIVAYVADHGIETMFGCASLRGTDRDAVGEQLAYLHHYHLAPEALRPMALGPAMNLMDRESIDVVRARAALEPLIKGYLREGAYVGEGAFVDHQFNSVDVCIVMPTARLARKSLRQYQSALERNHAVKVTQEEWASGLQVANTKGPQLASG